MHIALVEDDADQAELLTLWLTGPGHTVVCSSTAAACVDTLKSQRFDALVVDWLLPDGTGADILKWVRQNLGWELPVIVVTAKDDEATVVTALTAGADDYVVKPPKPMELLARIEAVVRRAKPGGLPVLRMGAYEIDVQQHRLCIDQEPVTLTQKEFELSVVLFQNPGKLLSRDHLLNKVWGIHADIDTRTVDTHISRLRKKLMLDGARGWKLVPVYGYGYRFDRVDAAAESTTSAVSTAPTAPTEPTMAAPLTRKKLGAKPLVGNPV